MQIKVLDTYNLENCVSLYDIDSQYSQENYLKQSLVKDCFQESTIQNSKIIDLNSVIPFLKKIIRNGEFRQQVFKKIKRNCLNQENNSNNYLRLQKIQTQNQANILKSQASSMNIQHLSETKNSISKNGAGQINESKAFLQYNSLGIEQTSIFLQLRMKSLSLTPRIIKDLFIVQDANLINLSVCLFAKFFYFNKQEIGRLDIGWIFVISYLLAAYLTQSHNKEEISSNFSEKLRIKKQNLMELSIAFLKKIEFQVSIETELEQFVLSKLERHYREC